MTMFETADMSEMEIRDAFGFTKTKPIVFKERGEDGQTIKTLSVSSMKLIRLDTDGKMGSLAITLEDGRELRICSAYLKEMQAARFTFETKVDVLLFEPLLGRGFACRPSGRRGGASWLVGGALSHESLALGGKTAAFGRQTMRRASGGRHAASRRC